MKITNYKITILFIFLLFFAFEVSAQTDFTSNIRNLPGGVFTITNLVNLIRSLACYFIQFGIIAIVTAFMIYGLMFLKSRGNAQEFGGARKALTWGIVGGLVIFGVFTIILSVASLIGVDYSPILNTIRCS